MANRPSFHSVEFSPVTITLINRRELVIAQHRGEPRPRPEPQRSDLMGPAMDASRGDRPETALDPQGGCNIAGSRSHGPNRISRDLDHVKPEPSLALFAAATGRQARDQEGISRASTDRLSDHAGSASRPFPHRVR
jgi:hypothetical protein